MRQPAREPLRSNRGPCLLALQRGVVSITLREISAVPRQCQWKTAITPMTRRQNTHARLTAAQIFHATSKTAWLRVTRGCGHCVHIRLALQSPRHLFATASGLARNLLPRMHRQNRLSSALLRPLRPIRQAATPLLLSLRPTTTTHLRLYRWSISRSLARARSLFHCHHPRHRPSLPARLRFTTPSHRPRERSQRTLLACLRERTACL